MPINFGAVGEGLISSGVTSLLNAFGSQLSADKQYQYSKKLAAQQFDYNKQLMQMQMDYNNPANQMSMYRQAGVNPYAALGNSTSISAGSVGLPSTPSYDLSQLGTNAVNTFQQGFLMKSQKDLQIAQAQQALAQTDVNNQTKLKLAADTKNQNIQNEILSRTSNDQVKLAQAEVALRWAQVGQQETQSALNELQALSQITLNKALPKQIEMELAEAASRINVQYLQGQLSKAQCQAALASAFESSCRAQGIQIDNKLQQRLANEYYDNYVEQNDKLRKEIEMLSKQNDWYAIEKVLGSVATGVASFYGAGKAGMIFRSLRRAKK